MRHKTINIRNHGSFDKKFDSFSQTLSHIPRRVRKVQKTRAKNSHAWAPLKFSIFFLFPCQDSTGPRGRRGFQQTGQGRRRAQKSWKLTKKEQNTSKDYRTRPLFIFSMPADSSKQFSASFFYLEKPPNGPTNILKIRLFYIFPKRYKNCVSLWELSQFLRILAKSP